MDEREAESRHEGSAVAPLDARDPRFAHELDAPTGEHVRTLVRSRGPGASPEEPNARILRVAVPLVALAGVVAVAVVFFIGLDPGSGIQPVGPESAIRAAVADRPHRVCLRGSQPCAWIALVEGELVAFNTNGPLPQEYGRLGIGWCPTSRWYGSNATGSRFDQRGRVVRGPAPRGLDRFTLVRTADGRLAVDFASLTAGLQAALTDETLPPEGAACDTIPFDRSADLVLDQEAH